MKTSPNARGKVNHHSRVVGKFPLNEIGEAFYRKAAEVVTGAGFRLKFELFKER